MNLATDYDRWHENVLAGDPSHTDETSPWYRLVLEYIGNISGQRILEVACGRGGFSKLLAERGALVCGTDFSGAAVRAATSKTQSAATGCTQAKFAQADAQNLPYADRSFDVVVSCETIEHLPDPRAALTEMARVCRAGGFLYLTTPNYVNAMGLYYLYARGRRRKVTPGGDQPLDRVFLFPQIRNMVRAAGWEIIRADGTVHQFPVWPGRNPVRLAAFESNRALRRLLSPLALHYFLMARNGRERA